MGVQCEASETLLDQKVNYNTSDMGVQWEASDTQLDQKVNNKTSDVGVQYVASDTWLEAIDSEIRDQPSVNKET